MVTFNPGPSQLTTMLQKDIMDITASGLLSISHRSKIFTDLTKSVIENLHLKFGILERYKIVFHHSATGAMETILRHFVKKKSFHFVNGAFSDRFAKTAEELGLQPEISETEWGKPVLFSASNIPLDSELICITHNETSTGLMWPEDSLKHLRNEYPNHLICWDMTSSFGGVSVDFTLSDITFFSVQKCLGLPAGLGLIVLSEKAVAHINTHKFEIPSWQNLSVMIDKMESYQTVETPNIFAISLLERQLKRWNSSQIISEINEKFDYLNSQSSLWQNFIEAKEWQSRTVLNLNVENPDQFHAQAESAGFTLGDGYGKLKNSCIRIANFPAITLGMLENLVATFKT